MTDRSAPAAIARLTDVAQRLGLDARALVAAAPLLLQHVARFGARNNLVGDYAAQAIVNEHLVESMTLAALIADTGTVPRRLIDVGAGAGIETMCLLLLWPEAIAVAVEPRQKRSIFIEVTADAIGVGRRLQAVRHRAGQHDDQIGRHAFDLATSRATFAPEAWLTIASAFVAHDGRVAAHLGSQSITVDPAWQPLGARAVDGRPQHQVGLWRRATV
jgi:16S rRNA G527 N7-methylase RsmG